MVPHVSLLEAIVSYTDYHRDFCIEALVELLAQVKDDLRFVYGTVYLCTLEKQETVDILAI